jgi:hypothetical protein
LNREAPELGFVGLLADVGSEAIFSDFAVKHQRRAQGTT